MLIHVVSSVEGTRWIVATLLVGCLAGAGRCDTEEGERHLTQEETRRLLEQGAIVSLQSILDGIDPTDDGRIIGTELEFEHGHYVYEIQVLKEDGRIAEYRFDACHHGTAPVTDGFGE